MKKMLPESYVREKTFVNTLIRRGGVSAIYEVKGEGRVLGYEVGCVQTRVIRAVFKNSYEGYDEYEAKWSNNDFGKIAWYITDKEQAINLFNELVTKNENVNN